jgi:hypothetical protein
MLKNRSLKYCRIFLDLAEFFFFNRQTNLSGTWQQWSAYADATSASKQYLCLIIIFQLLGKNQSVPWAVYHRAKGQPLADIRENARKVRAGRIRLLPHHLHPTQAEGGAGKVRLWY